MADMTIPETWDAALKCACQSIRRTLGFGGTIATLVDWFYTNRPYCGSDVWDDCVLRTRWDTHTWRGVYRAWDECGRPEFDPHGWGWDEWDPDSRRAAQGNARLDAVGEMVGDRFPEALEWAAAALGWDVRDGSDFADGAFPDGAVALTEGGLAAAAGKWHVTVLVPPASVSAA